ncbi:MAG TPA: retropepsin-like aspartic protease [Allosphingosinicella sp.]|nr:retropepsin-like aspartic protease [Allosphingosinicella sp.]
MTRRLFPALLSALCLFAAPCALASSQPAATSAPPATAAREGAFPIYMSGNRALAMIRIGAMPIPVVFDTGTTSNALDREFVEAIRLRQLGASSVLDGWTGTSFPAVSVSLAGATINGLALGDATADAYEYAGEDAAGLIGPNLFLGSLVYLELGWNRVRLRDKRVSDAPAGPGTPYLGPQDDSLPAVDIELPGGVTARAIMDSGATHPLSLPLAMADRLPLEASPRVTGRAMSVSGESPVYGARLRGTVRIGPVTLVNPDIRFVGRETVVGLRILRQLIVVLDPEARRSWVLAPCTPASTPMQDYVGRYEQRTVRIENGGLIYQREGRDPLQLRCLGEDLFESPAVGDLIQFRRREGRITGFDIVGRDNRVSAVPRVE